jgi:flagellum-specific peptidoglycan hydrolase FlgJ
MGQGKFHTAANNLNAIPKKRGPGRPSTGRVKVTLKFLPEIEELARKRAKALGIPKSYYIEQAILAASSKRS